MTQLVRPILDYSINLDVFGIPTWGASSGSDIFAMVNEDTPNDGNWAFANPDRFETLDNRSVVVFKLNAAQDPGIDTGFKVLFRVKRVATDISGLAISLHNGVPSVLNQLASGSVSVPKDTWTTFTINVTAASAANISNFQNLYIKCLATSSSSLGSDVRLSWLQLQIPDPPPPPPPPIPLDFSYIGTGSVFTTGTAGTDIGGITFGSGGILVTGAASILISFPPAPKPSKPVELFHLTVENQDRQTLIELPDWISGKWTRQLNRFSTTELRYPGAGRTIVQHLVYPNVIVLRDREGKIIDRFIIGSTKEIINRNHTIDIQCVSLYYQLSRANITEYVSGDKTLAQILNDLFTIFQTNTRLTPITLGAIDINISGIIRNITVKNTSITQVINKLYETIGGFIEVNENGIFTWNLNPRLDKPIGFLRWGHNMSGLVIEKNPLNVRTRINVQGKDENDNEVSAIIQADTDGTAETRFGLIDEFINISEPTTQESTTQLAEFWLNRLSIDRDNIQITEAVDLSKIDTRFDYAHEEFLMNNNIKIKHPVLGFLSERTIVGIEIQLENPQLVKLDLEDPDVGSFRKPQTGLLENLIDTTETIKTVQSFL